MTVFYFLFPGLATAVWRSAGCLDQPKRQQIRPLMPNQLTAAAAVAITQALVAALNTTRSRLKEVQRAVGPTEAELAALQAEDAEVDAALLAARDALDAAEAEDNPPAVPPAAPPADPIPPDPAPDPDPDPDPGTGSEPEPPIPG